MPVDSRRLQGPETAFSYSLLEEKDVDKPPIQKSFLKPNGKRKDGRKPTDSRPLFLKTGVVSQAKGSAYIEQGNTKVICGIYGPREVQKKSDFSLNGQLFCEFKYAPFSCLKRRGHQQDNQELELSGLLREALEAAVCLQHFPKAQVEVYIMVLEDDGSALAASLTCASLALANASIPMFDLVIGASLRHTPGQTLLDPLKEEEWEPAVGADESNCNLTIGYMPSLQQVCAYVHEGVSEAEELDAILKLATEYCIRVQPVAQLCLKEAIENTIAPVKDNEMDE